MKQVRGFGYVGDVEPDAELGFTESDSHEYLEVRAYNCPRCKRVLFEADINLHGVIFIRCRRCRREVAIETTPTMRRIGFIDTLYRKESHNDS